MKATISEPSSKVLPVDNDNVYETSIDCHSIDPFTTYIKIPDTCNLIDSGTIIDISKSHVPYSFDVPNI